MVKINEEISSEANDIIKRFQRENGIMQKSRALDAILKEYQKLKEVKKP